MKTWVSLLLLGFLSGPVTPPANPAGDEDVLLIEDEASASPAALLEGLRYNARERTSRSIELLEREDFAGAAESLETARRLDPDSPTAAYNLGTGHLHALDSRAVAELEAALENAPPSLTADTAYNLGNARFAANDFQGAANAYKSALRAEPSYENAKYNLELALKKLEEEQQQQEKNNSQSNSDSDDESSESGDQQSPPNDKQDEEQDSGEGEQENQEQGGQPDPEESDGEQQRNPLPQYQEQPEMSAEQAAAILEAVDNLERQQRQEDAQEKARPVPAGGKDW